MAKRSKQDVLKFVKENDVKFIRLWFTDLPGQVKSFSITEGELENALEKGMGFDGSSITGYQDIEESDMIAMLQAGLEGIEKGYKVPSAMEKNLYHLSAEQRKEQGIETLPDSLGAAIAISESSELVKKTLGDHIFPRFVELKKKEWDEYRIQVPQYELDKYLSIL